MSNKVIQRVFSLKDNITSPLKKINQGTVQYKKNLKDLKSVANDSFNKAKLGAVALAGATAGLVLGLGALANGTAKAGDRIDKTSQKLGLSRQGFQELDFVLSQNGVSIDQMGNGMKQLSQHMSGSTKLGSESANMFKRLGVSAKDSTGAFRKQEDVFIDLISSIQELPEGIEKANLAQKLFGRNGQDLLPMLNTSRGSIEDLREEFRNLGIAMSDEAIDNSVRFSDELDKLKRVGGGALRQLGAVSLPYFTGGIQWILDKVPKVRESAVNTFTSIKDAIDKNREKFISIKIAVIEIKDSIMNAFGSNGEGGSALNWLTGTAIPMVVGGVAEVLNGISNTYYFFRDNWSLISPVIYGITGALALYYAYTNALIIKKYALTTAQWAWNTAMNANPIGLVVMGIGALIAAGVFLIKNWDDVKLAGKKTWNGIVGFVEWGVNKSISGINFLVEKTISGLNSLIRLINKIPGIDIGEFEHQGIKAVDFSAGKFDVEGQEFNWGKKKFAPTSDIAFDDVLYEYDRKQEVKVQEQKMSNDNLIHALDENTATMKGSAGKVNDINVTLYASEMTPEEVAKKLVPSIKKELFGT